MVVQERNMPRSSPSGSHPGIVGAALPVVLPGSGAFGADDANETLAAVLRFGFEGMDRHQIHACPWAENVPSVRVLEKLASLREGIRRDEHWGDGAFRDEVLCALLRPEYFGITGRRQP